MPAYHREGEFWDALRAAIRADDLESATILVAEQMEAWQLQLQIVMDKLTHNGNHTVH